MLRKKLFTFWLEYSNEYLSNKSLINVSIKTLWYVYENVIKHSPSIWNTRCFTFLIFLKMTLTYERKSIDLMYILFMTVAYIKTDGLFVLSNSLNIHLVYSWNFNYAKS